MFKVFYKEEVGSTNDWAKEESITNAVFVADYQTNGRGRLERVWESPKGVNLCFSIKIKIEDYVQAIHYNFLTSLAVAKTLEEEYSLVTTIKWPNDILMENKKLSGVLSEIDSGAPQPPKGGASEGINVIIGVGINCNFDINDNSPIKKIATSLHYYLGYIDKEVLLEKILICFNILNEEYKKTEFKKILKKWNKYANIEGRMLYTTISNKKEVVKVIKMNNDASLIVERKDGRIETLIAGDIEYVEDTNN